eukprot:GEMP01046886.1.p1 GENE.GEMP01046886.1~~GEMP01046886.1.p1  ORF type:complete len:290 (+),score=46.98 GEMP01046886.1:281-1150(+)
MLGTRTPGRLPASRHEHYLIPTGNSITESHQCSDMTQDAASFPPRAAGVIHETSPYGHERSNSLKDGGPTSSRPQDSFTVPLGLNAEDTPTSRIKGDNTLSSHLKDENTPALRGSRGREGIVSPDTTPASRGSRGRIGSLVGEHIPASPGSGGMKWSMSEERTPTFCERSCQKVTLDGRTPASPRSSCREAWLSEECTPVPFGSSCRKIWVKGTPSRGGGTTVAARPAHKDAKRSVASDPVEAPTKVRRKPDANDGSIRRASISKRCQKKLQPPSHRLPYFDSHSTTQM